jgi:metallo-beta-lactamase family protein
MANEKPRLKITFAGGAGSVTGANFLLETLTGQNDVKVLIDCGLFQGDAENEKKNELAFPYDPVTIDALFVTHGHLDHIGRIPVLVKQGFTGPIYSTPPTKDIADLSFHDSLGIMTKEQRDQDGEKLSFDSADLKAALRQWQTVPYHEPITIGPLTIVFRDAGHILGSAMVELMLDGRKIVFTGDLGNSPTPLLPDTERVTDADYLVMESVYGDRNHEDRGDRRDNLEDVIEETMRAGGTLVIPAFSIERTQEILYEVEQMMENSRIPLVPVFIDSPLAIAITKLYKKYSDYLNEKVRHEITGGDVLFGFPQLKLTTSTEESKAILKSAPRKIIIAGSGMSTGGRVIHHEKAYLPDAKSTLLLIGYQSVGTLGRIIQDGAKFVKILGSEVPIRARVVNIRGYSSHKDSDGLLDFVAASARTLKLVLVAMGEPKASLFLVQRIRDYFGLNARAPEAGEEVILSW